MIPKFKAALFSGLIPGKSFYKLLFLFTGLLPFSQFAQTANQNPSCKIAFISDTQAPRWIEDVFLKSNNNEQATKILLNDIPKQNPSGINFLGDVVNLGCKNDRWKLIDSSLNYLHAAGFPTHACLGNHELMNNKNKGEQNFQIRFPDHVNTGYYVKYDSIANIFLNSNFSKMSNDQKIKQDKWYKQTLEELDTTPGIKVIIVTCHHSPYSDSKLVGSSQPVQDHFVPEFTKSKKCKLFITGHAHLFQHFNIQGKDFLVIGGGGGLHHPTKKKSCGQVDLAKNYKPMFHYITVTLYENFLHVTSFKLKDDFSGTEEGYSFDIALKN